MREGRENNGKRTVRRCWTCDTIRAVLVRCDCEVYQEVQTMKKVPTIYQFLVLLSVLSAVQAACGYRR
jgi:hypothetical protein